jgi:VWFA-related protein
LAGIAPLWGGGQQSDPQGAFSASVEVRVANVEVFVSDADGAPVPGLTAADFEVYENGRQVAITNFYAAPGVVQAEAARVGQAALPNPPADRLQSVSLVIFVDETNISPSGRRRAIRDVIRMLEGDLPAGLRTMLVTFDGSVHVRQDLTPDPSLALAAIDQLGPGVAGGVNRTRKEILRGMQENMLAQMSDDNAGDALFSNTGSVGQKHLLSIRAYSNWVARLNLATIDALRRFMSGLGGIPGRKAILFIGDGIEVAPGRDLLNEWVQVFPGVASAKRIEPFVESERNDITESVLDLVEFANSHRITIFKVGTAGSSRFDDSDVETKGKEYVRSSNQGIPSSECAAGAIWSLAQETGGVAMVTSKSLSEQLGEVAVELGSFYSLGYRPADSDDGRYRKIKVRVKREGLRLRYRDGLKDLNEEDQFASRTMAALMFGVTDNPLEVSLGASPQQPVDDDSYLVPLIIRVPLRRLTLLPEDDSFKGRVTVLLAVQDESGGQSELSRRESTVMVPSDEYEIAMERNADFTVNLSIAGGLHKLAVGVRDEYGEIEATTLVRLRVGEPEQG